MLTICGIHLGDPTDYNYIVGLTLNLPRAFSRNALASAIGYAVATNGKHVPAELLDGVSENEQEAKELAFRINTERDRAKFAAKAKHGLPGILGGK